LNQPPPSSVVLLSAVLSASIAAFLTNPLDVLKLHYQVSISFYFKTFLIQQGYHGEKQLMEIVF
jgi:hypothetical protein